MDDCHVYVGTPGSAQDLKECWSHFIVVLSVFIFFDATELPGVSGGGRTTSGWAGAVFGLKALQTIPLISPSPHLDAVDTLQSLFHISPTHRGAHIEGINPKGSELQLVVKP